MKVFASVPAALICRGVDSRPPGLLGRCGHLGGGTAFIWVLRLNLPWNRPRTASDLRLEGSPHLPPPPTSNHRHGASETCRAPGPLLPSRKGGNWAQVHREGSRPFADDLVVEGGKGSTRAFS